MTTRLEPETDVQFEVWQDGDMVASADALSDAEHFMLVYGQDGPVEAKTAITTRFPGFHMVSAAPAPAPEGMTGLINAAVDDLKIDPHWHQGRTFDERRLINDAFQNGVEIAADAILAIIAKGEGR
jgi:hypothetical protein